MYMYVCLRSLTGRLNISPHHHQTTYRYTQTHTTHTYYIQTHHTTHTHHDSISQAQSWHESVGGAVETPSLGIPFSRCLQSKAKTLASVSQLTQCLYHNDLFCFPHLNQFILPQETIFRVSAPIVKEPVWSGPDKAVAFYVISLVRVSLPLTSPSLYRRPSWVTFLPHPGSNVAPNWTI